ncbi:cytochrome c oxidase assembly protein [Nonomuraea sp. GTA35]|uniref:cytochrome c oxidase assembly protein n=1 Tax=Nonomuraea sp. GTA35 TaxID=1676746 RepID=UPI0035BF88D3
MTAHHAHAGAVTPALLLLALVAYLIPAARAASWKGWRSAMFAAGLALVAAAVTGPIAAWAATDFRGHMVQHLLIGMLAPLGLVLGAPMTLLLRSLPAAHARRLARLLRHRAAHAVANPVTALVLSAGGMIVLYCTPLYRHVMTNGRLHAAVHVHFLLSGCLFAWVIAGPDPAPRRPSVVARLVVLGVAIAAHSGLSQLMYAGIAVDLPVPEEQRRGAAEIMYYGGDLAELLLALALVAGWRPHPAARRRVAGTGRPGQDSPFFRDADTVAAALLAAPDQAKQPRWPSFAQRRRGGRGAGVRP